MMSIFGFCAFLYENSNDNERKRNITLISLTAFYIFFGIRGYLYTDWVEYSKVFETVEWRDVFLLTSEHKKGVVHEPGFTLLCLLCRAVVNEYAFLVMVITAIDTALLVRFLRRLGVENYSMVFMLIIPFDGLGLMFNLLRNQLAIFIFLNALEYIETRQPLKYFSLCTLALCFHLSSLMFFPLYLFSRVRINRWVFASAFLGLFVFYVSNISIITTLIELLGFGGALAEKATIYTENFTSSRLLSPTGTLEKFGLCLLVFIYYDDLIDKLKYRRMIINCLLMYFTMYYFLAEFRMLSMRLSFLFIFSYWIIWLDLIHMLTIRRNRILLGSIIYMYSVYMLLFNINSPVQEYDNLLFGGMTQEERMVIFNKTFDQSDD